MAIAATLVGSTQLTSAATTVTLSATTTTGSSWVVFVSNQGGYGVTPVTDNKGNTYVQIGGDVTAFTVVGTLWYKENGTGGASHIFTGTNASSNLATIIVIEITGGATSGILDQSRTGNDDVATPFTSSVTGATSQANEVVLAFTFDNRSTNSGLTWGASFLSLVDVTNNNFITCAAAKLNVTSIGTQQSSFTSAVTTEAVTYIATFKELGGAAPVTPRTIYHPRKIFYPV